MKALPEALLKSLEPVRGFDREAFVRVHESNAPFTSVRVNPAKAVLHSDNWQLTTPDFREPRELSFHTQPGRKVPWTEFGYYLEERPPFTFDPLFHAGTYYVQEASSMFLEQAFRQLIPLSSPLKVLDLCGAPGGKSTHIQSLIPAESLLVSNEVIRSRSHVLADNLLKWGAANVLVTNNDPSAFSRVAGYFDVLVVDAPCSGSGLFRRDDEAIDEWSTANVQLCFQRQQRILADVLPSLKSGGLLVYSTCSYSKEEDEDIADWLVENFDMGSVPLELDPEWRIIPSESAKHEALTYRFYPYRVKGEGFFLACFRKRENTEVARQPAQKWTGASAKEKAAISPWMDLQNLELLKEEENFFGVPSFLVQDYLFLRSRLHVMAKGISIGQVMKERLVPHHALALSGRLGAAVVRQELTLEDAIRYLQRQELSFLPKQAGWQVMTYGGHPLGWANVLSSRMNNYYPKELRILKQSAPSFEK